LALERRAIDRRKQERAVAIVTTNAAAPNMQFIGAGEMQSYVGCTAVALRTIKVLRLRGTFRAPLRSMRVTNSWQVGGADPITSYKSGEREC
jgi:hypothetical protein